jgi:chromosome segregation ATPase
MTRVIAAGWRRASESQIGCIKAGIGSIQSENADYLRQMKRLVGAIREIGLANEILQSGIDQRRHHLENSRSEISQLPVALEHAQNRLDNARRRRAQYQRQALRITPGTPLGNYRSEIEKLEKELDVLKGEWVSAQSRLSSAQDLVGQMATLGKVKCELAAISEKLRQAGHRLLELAGTGNDPQPTTKAKLEKVLQRDIDQGETTQSDDLVQDVDTHLKAAVPVCSGDRKSVV